MEHPARAPAPPDPQWDWAELRETAGRVAHQVLGDSHEADDAVQEAMIRAWRRRATCRSPEAPHAWLRQIARNEAVRWSARVTPTPMEELPVETADAQATEEVVIDRVFLAQALRGLRSDDDRRLVVLRYELDLPDVAIAKVLGIAESTVRVRLHRLKKRLSVLIEDPRTR